MTVFEIAILALAAVTLVLCVLLLLRRGGVDDAARKAQLDGLATRLAELGGTLNAGLAGLREESAGAARLAREEAAARLDVLAQGLSNARIEGEAQAKGLREELTRSFATLAEGQSGRLDGFATQLAEHRKGAGEDARALREEVGGATRTLTEGTGIALKEMREAAERRAEALRTTLAGLVKELTEASERRQEELRRTVEARLDALRSENAAKLEEMRVTVDEKLQGTLEARLGASFTTVNENLERVFKSVGEMQQIATGVGDLKRVLSNVKSRGTWGETTLGMLLEQVMTPEQYAQNVEVKPGSGCRVEYAIKLPGDGETPVWLPIDAKLPTEDYERLVEASERGDAAAVEEAARGLERAIRKCGQDIGTKYVDPPHSTDFGIMFLPTEGLFAEVARRPGLVDALQREARVTVAGPTTLMATLVALRMGFRTLAIQQRSSEVWQVLGAVKSEFGKFGDVLDKVSKKLGEAQNVVETAGVRRRAVDRKLRSVEALPEAAARDVLALTAPTELAEELEDAAE